MSRRVAVNDVFVERALVPVLHVLRFMDGERLWDHRISRYGFLIGHCTWSTQRYR